MLDRTWKGPALITLDHSGKSQQTVWVQELAPTAPVGKFPAERRREENAWSMAVQASDPSKNEENTLKVNVLV